VLDDLPGERRAAQRDVIDAQHADEIVRSVQRHETTYRATRHARRGSLELVVLAALDHLRRHRAANVGVGGSNALGRAAHDDVAVREDSSTRPSSHTTSAPTPSSFILRAAAWSVSFGPIASARYVMASLTSMASPGAH
jgi:hypothetical protein